MTTAVVTAMDRFAAVTGDPSVMEAVGQRVMEGETLRKIAHAWEIPVMKFIEWVTMDVVRCGVYHAALKVRADELAHETLAIADGTDANSEDVKRDGLRVRARMTLAGHFDPQRFGARLEKNVNVRVGRLASELTDDELSAIIERANRDARVIEGTSTRVVEEAKQVTSEPIAAGTGLI